jgi:outer membrane protein assembly factor BamB
VSAIWLFQIAPPVRAQWGQTVAGDLSPTIRVDEIDPAARALLERVKANVAEKQWDEAVDTLRQVMEQQGTKLIRLDETRFIPVREYCQIRLAELPDSARALYRSRVDPLAKQWYDEGLAAHNAEPLRRVVDQLFLSSWTDKALLALGDMALEEGAFSRARWCWERISPALRTPDGRPLWLDLRAARETGAAAIAAKPPEPAAQAKGVASAPQWLAYPDTRLNLAEVRARLVLASILEGSLVRARIELADFARRHPETRGKIAGREGAYADLLAGMLKTAEQRPAPKPPTDWLTFADSFDRTMSAAPDPGPHTAWSRPIDLPLNHAGPFRADVNINREPFGLPERRPAEDQRSLMCFHPLVVGNLVLLNSLDKIYAFDLRTGEPAWPDKTKPEMGEIYSGRARQDTFVGDTAGNQFHTFGVPRFTMSVVAQRLYARLGSPITGRQLGSGVSTGGSYLVCLDLSAQGRLVWRIPQTSQEEDRWAFEGSPVCDGDNVYVALRYNDSVAPQEHVACYDAQTGVERWRRLVCSAESPARGLADEITNNLLTLDHDTLYLNTNLGAIAAISTDGQIRWLSQYPRAKHSSGSDHGDNFYRDLNPCVFYRGSVLAAPTDCEEIFSLDGSTGQLLWASSLPRDVVHLLGVGGGNLIASGQSLWWLNVDGGKVIYRWPDQTTVHGYGRGALVGDEVYFPTRSEIHVFRQALGHHADAEGHGSAAIDPTQAEVREPIRLDTRNPPQSGGNLVVAGGYLLIATPDKLFALGPHAAAAPIEREVTQAGAQSRADPPEPTHPAAEQ